MKIPETQKIIEALEDEYHLRSYSGRGMFGRCCLAIEVAHLMRDAMRIGALFNSNLPEDEAHYLINQAVSDSLGMEYIIYFPHVSYTREEEREHNGR